MTDTRKLLIATFNKGKIGEIKNLFNQESGFSLCSLADLNITETAPENGTTFEENAAAKALFYSRKAKNILTMAEDSGLVVAALGGEPGILSARYAGPDADSGQNIDLLLTNMRKLDNRAAKFVAVAALARNGELIRTFTGEVAGEILRERRGRSGFGYDPVFYYPPFRKTFAQLSTTEKNRVSHRFKALQKLRDYLKIK